MAIKVSPMQFWKDSMNTALEGGSAEAVGQLAMSMADELEKFHREIGIDTMKIDDDGYIDYDYKPAADDYKNQFESLRKEYLNRFSGKDYYSRADDMMISYDPHSGQEHTSFLENYDQRSVPAKRIELF